jgi:hypothetical protein
MGEQMINERICDNFSPIRQEDNFYIWDNNKSHVQAL